MSSSASDIRQQFISFFKDLARVATRDSNEAQWSQVLQERLQHRRPFLVELPRGAADQEEGQLAWLLESEKVLLTDSWHTDADARGAHGLPYVSTGERLWISNSMSLLRSWEDVGLEGVKDLEFSEVFVAKRRRAQIEEEEREEEEEEATHGAQPSVLCQAQRSAEVTRTSSEVTSSKRSITPSLVSSLSSLKSSPVT